MENEKKHLKIAFLTSMDPQDKRAWSGILFHTREALREHCGDVVDIGPTDVQEKPGKRAFLKKLRVFVKKNFAYAPFFALGRKYFVCNFRIATAKRFARSANPRLAAQSFDVVFAPASTTEVAFIETKYPLIMFEDATFEALHDYYPQYSGLPRNMAREMNRLSKRAIEKSTALIYASSWAAQSAIRDYGADPKKVFVAPMGANFENPPSHDAVEQKRRSNHCRLLFGGFDWERKGGDIAFETLLKLEEMGIEAELVVVGCVPPKKFAHERMRVIPYLDKNDPAQYRELQDLYMTADFFLLPTRTEAYGIVFCEASAYGLPSITTRTGGVPEVVRDGENGFTLPLSARGAEYAEVIARLYRDEQEYAKLVTSSRAAFDERLNWDAWGATVQKIMKDVLVDKKNDMPTDVSIESIAGS